MNKILVVLLVFVGLVSCVTTPIRPQSALVALENAPSHKAFLRISSKETGKVILFTKAEDGDVLFAIPFKYGKRFDDIRSFLNKWKLQFVIIDTGAKKALRGDLTIGADQYSEFVRDFFRSIHRDHQPKFGIEYHPEG